MVGLLRLTGGRWRKHFGWVGPTLVAMHSRRVRVGSKHVDCERMSFELAQHARTAANSAAHGAVAAIFFGRTFNLSTFIARGKRLWCHVALSLPPTADRLDWHGRFARPYTVRIDHVYASTSYESTACSTRKPQLERHAVRNKTHAGGAPRKRKLRSRTARAQPARAAARAPCCV